MRVDSDAPGRPCGGCSERRRLSPSSFPAPEIPVKRGTLLSALCVSLPLLVVSARVPAASTATAGTVPAAAQAEPRSAAQAESRADTRTTARTEGATPEGRAQRSGQTSGAVDSPGVSTEAVLAQAAVLAHAVHDDALESARAMQQAIERLLSKPSDKALQVARQRWLAAREIYGRTEAFRWRSSPFDGLARFEPRLDAWPLDEAHIDYVEGDEYTGLINDRTVSLDGDALLTLHGQGGPEKITLGWQAIEFMLWGQDVSEEGPGARAHTDFIDGERPNAERRRQYLQWITAQLVEDLQTLRNAWAPGQDAAYRAAFEQGGAESLRRMMRALIGLTRDELAAERIEVPLGTQDQEDELSCFSDNTDRDLVAAVQGIQSVWQGLYRRRDGRMLRGASLERLLAAAQPELARQTGDSIAASLAAAQAIQAPFELEILGDDSAPGRRRLQHLFESLMRQADALTGAAAALGLELRSDR